MIMTGRSKTGSQSKYRIVAIATITVFPLMLPAHADDGKIRADPRSPDFRSGSKG
jgi:hypothetical protein